MLVHTIGLETYAITLYREGQIKVWDCTKLQCIAVDVSLPEARAPHDTSLKNSKMLLICRKHVFIRNKIYSAVSIIKTSRRGRRKRIYVRSLSEYG